MNNTTKWVLGLGALLLLCGLCALTTFLAPAAFQGWQDIFVKESAEQTTQVVDEQLPADPTATPSAIRDRIPTQEVAPTSIPSMEWTNGKKSRSYQVYDAGTHLEWWMDPYNHLDTGEITLVISDFSEITFNNVSDGDGYIVEILDKTGRTVYIFSQHANHFNNGLWWEVLPEWYTIHIVWTNPNNESNGCVVFARP